MVLGVNAILEVMLTVSWVFQQTNEMEGKIKVKVKIRRHDACRRVVNMK